MFLLRHLPLFAKVERSDMSSKKESFIPLEPEVVKRIKAHGTKAQNDVCKKMGQFGWRISDVYVSDEDTKQVAIGLAAPGNKAVVYPNGDRRMCSGSTQTLVLNPGWSSLGDVLAKARKVEAQKAKFEALCIKYEIPEDATDQERKRMLADAILEKMLKI